jgi:hypothetical protein
MGILSVQFLPQIEVNKEIVIGCGIRQVLALPSIGNPF